MVNSLWVLLNGDVALHAAMEVAADVVGKPVCVESKFRQLSDAK
jgi:hypothetical protein